MKFYAKVVTALFVGLLSLMTLAYFYEKQRDFSRTYKEVISDFQALNTLQDKLSDDIMKSSLFAYHNQDSIANHIRELQQRHTTLMQRNVLDDPEYASVKNNVNLIGIAIARHTEAIESYLMLNAGIKNSLIFLNSYNERSATHFKENDAVHNTLDHVIHRIANARRMFEADYLDGITAELDYLKMQRYTPEQQQYIDTVLLHATYITANFPDYINTINKLLDDAPKRVITITQESYEIISQSDVEMLDSFAFTFSILFSGALGGIILLLLRAEIENRRLKALQKTLEYTATHDALTDLLNRREFERVLPQSFYPTLLLVNIDRFKHVNDFYGTDVGNTILQEIAELIKLPGFQHYNPAYFRLGGDDFGVLLENIDDVKARTYARTIVETIGMHRFLINDIEISVTVSVAINSTPSILENADMALKHLKSNPSENIITFSQELGLKEKVQHNIETLALIQEAIEEDHIVPFFQPIVNLETGTIEKYEALARIIMKDGTLLLPGIFLDVAAQTPLYRDITRIILKKSIDYFTELPYRFSINMSMRDLLDTELMEMLKTLLSEHSETAKRLDFELLESENLHDLCQVQQFIADMQRYGCKISIDDFGSGYSNFSYLTTLAIDTLKIDGSLVLRMKDDPRHFQAVKTIVEYATSLDMQTIAEFVEDAETAKLLHSIGVTYAQGYHFGKPSESL